MERDVLPWPDIEQHFDVRQSRDPKDVPVIFGLPV